MEGAYLEPCASHYVEPFFRADPYPEQYAADIEEVQTVDELASQLSGSCDMARDDASAPRDSQLADDAPESAVQMLPPLEWRECATRCVVRQSPDGRPINCELGDSGCRLRVSIELKSPFLFWADRPQWRWHKRWPIPTITARVETEGGRAPPPELEQLQVMVSAGTLEGEGEAELLQGQMLVSVPAQLVEIPPQGAAEVRFSRLKFQQTSFASDGRPLHLVVTVCALRHSEEALTPLACICAPPVHVDSRKRFRKERPRAATNDMRFANRTAVYATSRAAQCQPGCTLMQEDVMQGQAQSAGGDDDHDDDSGGG